MADISSLGIPSEVAGINWNGDVVSGRWDEAWHTLLMTRRGKLNWSVQLDVIDHKVNWLEGSLNRAQPFLHESHLYVMTKANFYKGPWPAETKLHCISEKGVCLWHRQMDVLSPQFKQTQLFSFGKGLLVLTKDSQLGANLPIYTAFLLVRQTGETLASWPVFYPTGRFCHMSHQAFIDQQADGNMVIAIKAYEQEEKRWVEWEVDLGRL